MPGLNEDLELTIAGSGDGQWLDKYLPMKGVTSLGFVEDKNQLFEECDLALAPIFFGSGTRIKVVEPYSLGRPVITSKSGAKGCALVAGEDYIEAQTADEWTKALNNLESYDLEKMAASGAKRLKDIYDEKVVALGLLMKMRELHAQGASI